MVYRIDVNCDMGESFGAYTIGRDEEVIQHVTSVNVACGFHAGDPMVMRRTVKLAKKYGVAVGAHPGFPDLMGFGRRNMSVTREEAHNYMTYQIGALRAFCNSENIELQHVKAHGALYNMAVDDPDLAAAIAESVKEFTPTPVVLVLAKSQLQRTCEDAGLKVAREAFADRAYNPDGTLVSRRIPGAVIKDKEQIEKRVLHIVRESKVFSLDGKPVDLGRVDSICVHGDNPEAVEIAAAIRSTFQREGISVVPLRQFL
jgi:UPF0271 protein